MCFRIIGSALCCCLQLGTKLLMCIICSSLGILLIGGLIIYFVFFHNKSEKTTKADATTVAITTVSVAVRAMAKQLYNHHLKQHLFGGDVDKEKDSEDIDKAE
ncbi:protein midgut expression 1 [Drosophila obscura]|uniref:protein midgut expression 1 n=1 Tax=Drosophila obscura TaxID=7282 RepID=UPI001BB25997|nr:protein midgut expression 1 [Drosophila obscura]